MVKPVGLLRAGFPYDRSLGMRRITDHPTDIAFGNDGKVYVLCRGLFPAFNYPEIRVLNVEGDDLGTICGGGRGEDALVWPTTLIKDRDDNLYISDEQTNRVTIWNTNGDFQASWGTYGSGDGQVDRPAGIAFDPDDNIYLTDAMNHRVQKFTKDGKYLGKWGEFGSGEGQLNMPWGISVDEEGDVYIADWRNDRIQKFSGDGNFIFGIGRSGSGAGEFNRPANVEVDKDGDIYVADRGNNRVQLFNADGHYIEEFRGDATLSKIARVTLMANPRPLRLRQMVAVEPQKRFRGPVSVRIDSNGRMFVADFGSFRVQVYQKEAYALDANQIAPPLRSPSLETT